MNVPASKYIRKLKQIMSNEHMRAGEELPENNPDPFDSTPFTRIDEVKLSSDEWIDTILTQAEKIRRTTKRQEAISDDGLVIDSLALPPNDDWVSQESFYVTKVGPVAETCESLEWKSAYTMDVEDAPHPKSDEFREAASELQIPNSVALKLGPDFVASAYRVLYEHTKETGRPIHPIRIRYESTVKLPERGYRSAFSYLDKLPGVNPPSKSVAWEYVGQETVEATGESHA